MQNRFGYRDSTIDDRRDGRRDSRDDRPHIRRDDRDRRDRQGDSRDYTPERRYGDADTYRPPSSNSPTIGACRDANRRGSVTRPVPFRPAAVPAVRKPLAVVKSRDLKFGQLGSATLSEVREDLYVANRNHDDSSSDSGRKCRYTTAIFPKLIPTGEIDSLWIFWAGPSAGPLETSQDSVVQGKSLLKRVDAIEGRVHRKIMNGAKMDLGWAIQLSELLRNPTFDPAYPARVTSHFQCLPGSAQLPALQYCLYAILSIPSSATSCPIEVSHSVEGASIWHARVGDVAMALADVVVKLEEEVAGLKVLKLFYSS